MPCMCECVNMACEVDGNTSNLDVLKDTKQWHDFSLLNYENK